MPPTATTTLMATPAAALKQQAAALELKKQPEKALAIYAQLLEDYGGTDEVDVALRNRVGDLHLRVGNVDDAVALFEKSADEYALSGFLNNAIALCNKILRQRPGHVTTLRRLARYSAEKGLVVDAQRHYLAVAEALERLGQHSEALKALSEFAELSPDDVHVRTVVVEQLLRGGRRTDALPHLTVLHRLHQDAGRDVEADAVAQVAREIDADWVPDAGEGFGRRNDGSLVFMSSDEDFGALEAAPLPELGAPDAGATVGGLEGLELTSAASASEDELALPSVPSGELELPDMPAIEPPVVPDVRDTPTELEPVSDLDFLDIGASEASAGTVEADDPFALPAPDFGADAFGGPAAGASDDYVALESNDLPLLDVDVPLSPAEAHKDVLDLPPAPPRNTPLATPQVPQPIRPSRPTPSFVNLAEWLAEDAPSTPRMTIGEPAQSGDEQADFQNILSEFRAGIEAVIPEDDADSHYDLGIAFREMGLLDDAIAEFQTALRGTERRAETLEALGGCFLAKEQPEVARTLLLRALEEPAAPRGDDGLRGVLYLLGRACEDLGTPGEAIRYYQRVYAVDIRFKDVAARIQALQKSPR